MADGVTRLGIDELVTGQTGQTSGLCTLCPFRPAFAIASAPSLSFAWHKSCKVLASRVRVCLYMDAGK